MTTKDETKEWVTFDAALGSGQRLPPERKCVLVQSVDDNDSTAPSVAVGYLRFAAGDPDSPYFVTPGVGRPAHSWCDCLGDDFSSPLWNLPGVSKAVIVDGARPDT